MVMPPTSMVISESGWKPKPWIATSRPASPLGGLRKSDGGAMARLRANPICWLGPAYSPSRVSAQTR